MSTGAMDDYLKADLTELKDHGLLWTAEQNKKNSWGLKGNGTWYIVFDSKEELREFVAGLLLGYKMGINPDHYWRKHTQVIKVEKES